MEKNRGNIDDVYFAKLAKQAERYDEMAERMRNIGNVGSPLFVKERNLLSVASKSAVWVSLSVANHQQRGAEGEEQGQQRQRLLRQAGRAGGAL